MSHLTKHAAFHLFNYLITGLNAKSTEFDCHLIWLYGIAARSQAFAYVPYSHTAQQTETSLAIHINELSFDVLEKKSIKQLLHNKYLLESKTHGHYRFSRKGALLYLRVEKAFFGKKISFQNSMFPVPAFTHPQGVINLLTIPYEERKHARAFGAKWSKENKLWYCHGQPNEELEKLSRYGFNELLNRLDDDTPIYYANFDRKIKVSKRALIKQARDAGLKFDRYQQRWYALASQDRSKSTLRFNPLIRTLVLRMEYDPDNDTPLTLPTLPEGMSYIKSRKPSTVSLVAYYELKLLQALQQQQHNEFFVDLGKRQHVTEHAILFYIYANGEDKKYALWIPKHQLNKEGKVNNAFIQFKIQKMMSELDNKPLFFTLDESENVILINNESEKR